MKYFFLPLYKKTKIFIICYVDYCSNNYDVSGYYNTTDVKGLFNKASGYIQAKFTVITVDVINETVDIYCLEFTQKKYRTECILKPLNTHA